MFRTKMHAISDAERDCRAAVMKAIEAYITEISAVEILALLAYTVGQVIALQYQRSMTASQALELVRLNIELGNADVINELASSASMSVKAN